MRVPLILLPTLIIGLASCDQNPPAPEKAPTLEGVIGVYSQQQEIGHPDAAVLTGIMLKLHGKNGAVLTDAATVEIKGPSGWNDNQPVSAVYPAGAHWYVQPVSTATPDTGVYTFTVLDGELKGQSITSTLKDNKIFMPLTSPAGTLEAQKLNVTWRPAQPATAYYVRGMDATTGTGVGETFTKETTAVLSAAALDASHNYYAVVYAANFDTTTTTPSLPTQLLVSDSVGSVGVKASTLNIQSKRAQLPVGFGR